jgi:hypothetical protein
VLVAPVLREGVTDREVYLPQGDWFDFWTARPLAGARSFRVPVTIDSVPIFVRAGTFVFRQPVVQNTGEMPGQPLIVSVFPAERSDATLYEDEGESFAHERGVFSRRRFEQRRDDAGVSVRVAAPEGPYRPAARDLVVHLPGTLARRVLVGGAEAARLAADDEKGAGWRLVDGEVTVRLRDPFAAVEVRAEF